MQTCWALATPPAIHLNESKPTKSSKFHVTTPEDRLRNLESTFQQLATKSDTPDLRQAINDLHLSLREEIARAGTTMVQRDLSTTRFFGAMAVVGATSMMTSWHSNYFIASTRRLDRQLPIASRVGSGDQQVQSVSRTRALTARSRPGIPVHRRQPMCTIVILRGSVDRAADRPDSHIPTTPIVILNTSLERPG